MMCLNQSRALVGVLHGFATEDIISLLQKQTFSCIFCLSSLAVTRLTSLLGLCLQYFQVQTTAALHSNCEHIHYSQLSTIPAETA